MRRIIMLTVLASLALGAAANDGVELSMKGKALVAASSGAFVTPARQGSAPFTAFARDPMPQLMELDQQDKPVTSSACDSSVKTVCYDLTDQRVVYRGGRQFMPSMQGLTAESVSFRHNRIVFKYSFK